MLRLNLSGYFEPKNNSLTPSEAEMSAEVTLKHFMRKKGVAIFAKMQKFGEVGHVRYSSLQQDAEVWRGWSCQVFFLATKMQKFGEVGHVRYSSLQQDAEVWRGWSCQVFFLATRCSSLARLVMSGILPCNKMQKFGEVGHFLNFL